MQQNWVYVDSLRNWYPYFSQNLSGSFPADFHHVVCFITLETYDFFNHIIKTLENAANPIPWERTGI